MEYTIQSVNQGTAPSVAVTITSQPVKTEEPIVIDAKSDITNILYNQQAKVLIPIHVFSQGQLVMIKNQPNWNSVYVHL